jgi:hypothetical protein
MNTDIQSLKRQVALLRWYTFTSILITIGLVLSAYERPVQKFDVIRAKGIVIEDSIGRDRILIGAPIPHSKDRVRTDTALVRKHWAGNFGNPDQYMEWYKNYNNGADGIVVMNENGFDRVLLGDKLADPNTGKRMFESSGILWNDKQGWEKGGAGVNSTSDGKSRSIIGVDNANGEAAHLMALEDGTNALAIQSEEGMILLGFSQKDGQFFQNKASFLGIKVFDTKGQLVWEQKMNK